MAYDESRLPEWQRWLNSFCENWIFAFLVAMAIRHFCLEAFRIPTSSMEPMLYGDVGMNGDHVVVDKLWWRFTGTHRWDVTVFQYPRPELENGDDARPAVDSTGRRLDVPLIKPLFCRNFVKRCLVLPGDTFYFANGDLHLKDGERFSIPQKSASTQEAIWLDIWQHGDQPGYRPWSAVGGAVIEGDGDGPGIGFSLTAGATATFTQPLRNLWIKPGPVMVAPIGQPELAEVDVSLTKPLFEWKGRPGNVWNLDAWSVNRLTVRDQRARGSDSSIHGANLNGIMNEWLRDVRLVGQLTAIQGQVELHLRQGKAHDLVLAIDAQGWKARIDGQEVGSGSGSLVGRRLAFGHLDGRLGVWIDGERKVDALVDEVDTQIQRARLDVTGEGRIGFGSLLVQRDVHYTARGFLADDTAMVREYDQRANNAANPLLADQAADYVRMAGDVRAQLLGKLPSQLTQREKVGPIAFSPATAVTAPAGCYLMLGDNSPFSLDGRMWGFVPEENLRGRALSVVFPPSRWRIVR